MVQLQGYIRCYTPLSEYPTREFINTMSTSSLSGGEASQCSLHFIRYKAKYRVLYNGRTNLVTQTNTISLWYNEMNEVQESIQ